MSEEDPYDVMVPKPTRYIEYYQNDEPFYVVFTTRMQEHAPVAQMISPREYR